MRFCILIALTVLGLAALEDPAARLAKLDEDAQAAKMAYLRDWLSRANLDPVPVPVLDNPRDARPSEAQAAKLARDTNEALALAKRIRDQKPVPGMSDAGPTEIWRIDARVRMVILNAEKLRGAPTATAAPTRKPPTGGIVNVRKDDQE
jgi:hypothetical protein